jgi:hypothetical protein
LRSVIGVLRGVSAGAVGALQHIAAADSAHQPVGGRIVGGCPILRKLLRGRAEGRPT